jgi:3-oxoacyl-[acyl-carrier-protein] synthase II
MNKRRVAITGLGIVSPLGETAETFFASLCEGKSGITTISRWDATKFPTCIGGECKTFDITQYGVDVREAKRLDRFAQFGLAASVSAIKDSGIDFAQEDGDRVGVLIGTGIGGIETLQEQNGVLVARGVGRVSPFTVPRLMANAASGNVSIRYGFRAHCSSVSTACASAANAIGDACRLIQHGYTDLMIAGGAEAALCELGMASFCAARAMSTRNDAPGQASRPWDKDRDGFVMGEGAGVLLLEEWEHAVKRGARIYAELIGYGATADAYHITQPDEQGKGASAAMNLALKDGGVSPDVVNYINAHGTSTPLGDIAETIAIKNSFGEQARRLVVNSTKSMVGHSLGASGGVEAVAVCMSIKNQVVHPTVNLDNQDPQCDLDYVPHKARPLAVNYALSNSFGFGGHNACLLFKKP